MAEPAVSGPPEPPGGQDDEPPNAGLLVGALLAFLVDLRNDGAVELPSNLRLRRRALEHVLRRAREHGVAT
jgi:hypothetical protein